MAGLVAGAVGGILTVGSVVSLVVSYVAWGRRDHPAALPLAKMAAVPGVAGLSFAATVVYPHPPPGRWLLAVGNGLLTVTVAYFLLFALVYTGHGTRVTRRRRVAVVALFGSLGVAVAAETAFAATVTVETVGGLTLPVAGNQRESALYLLALVPTYAAVATGLGLLARFLVASRNVYRAQTAVVIAAVGATVAGSVAFETGLSPHPGLNLTVVFYAVEVVLIAFALFRYELLNVEPLAPAVVLEGMDDPVVVVGEGDTLVDANPPARRLFGEQGVGSSVDDALPGLLDAARRDEEYRYPGPRSEAPAGRVYDINDSPVTDQYGRDRGSVVVLRDITVQKDRERALEGLQSVNQAFLTAETRADVLETAVDAAYELLGYPYSGAMVYDDDADLLRPAAFADPLAAAFRASEATELSVGPGDGDIWRSFESGEPMLGDAIDGGGDTEIPVEIGGSLLYPLGDHGVLGISAAADHDGFSDEDRWFAAILAATTENALDRVDKERQLRRSNELLAARTDQIEFFNGVLRHNLLNGIHVVDAHVDLLESEVTEAGREHLETIDSWMSDITSLAETVRSVTQTVTGDQPVELESVDLGETLDEAVERVRNEYVEATVTVAVDTGRLPTVRANDLLGEVFWNLLSNAVAHNDAGAADITVESGVTDETVTIRIRDDGPGVDDGMKEAIFEEGVTSSDSGSVGFGLYFVQVMVEQYGGDVWFEDNEPRGAVAVVELPVGGETREALGPASQFRAGAANRTD